MFSSSTGPDESSSGGGARYRGGARAQHVTRHVAERGNVTRVLKAQCLSLITVTGIFNVDCSNICYNYVCKHYPKFFIKLNN